METDADLIQVINRTARVENLLNQVIQNFCAPRQEAYAFFWTVVLDSSIIPFNQKARVALAIARAVAYDLDQDPFHQVMSFRNAFAHDATDANPVLEVGKSEADMRSRLELQILRSSGRIDRVPREQALAEFLPKAAKAEASLIGLLAQIRVSSQQPR